jgi:hypothetical protein
LENVGRRTFISKHHPGFVVNEAFAQNVFYLGGVPRLLTEFAKKVSNALTDELTETFLRNLRMGVLSNLQFPQLSFSDTLKLLAASFTNTHVSKLGEIPFPNSEQAHNITWSQMISNGVCMLHDDGMVTVPFHLVAPVLDIPHDQLGKLNKYEKALVYSLNDLSNNVELLLNAFLPSQNLLPKTWHPKPRMRCTERFPSRPSLGSSLR